MKLPTLGLLISMAFRHDHSFGLEKRDDEMFGCGYTREGRIKMIHKMAKIYHSYMLGEKNRQSASGRN